MPEDLGKILGAGADRRGGGQGGVTGHSQDRVRAGVSQVVLFKARRKESVGLEVKVVRKEEDHCSRVIGVLSEEGLLPRGFELLGKSPKGRNGGVILDA